jgi:hypothetical protein
LRHAGAVARRQRAAATGRALDVLQRAGVDCSVERLAEAVLRQPVALNFHPDRIAADGRMVVESLLEDGIYRSQFETRISNGGLSAVPGGDRDRWEQALFGGAYQVAGVPLQSRPKYGGLNVLRHPDGPCPRFGSCHLRLRPPVLRRTTFCFGDSHAGPNDTGTDDAFECVLAALLEAATTGDVLGRRTTVAELVAELIDPGAAAPSVGHGRALDDYIEAQVHGPLRLAADVEGVVADPSFVDTAVGRLLEQVADRHGLALCWHGGFELSAGDVPADFRGPAIPLLAQRLAHHFDADVLHAERIGAAARDVVTRPERWADWASPADTLQHLKQLWHVLVRFGRPAT